MLSRLKRLAPFFIVGPISGPLLAGVVLNFQAGRPVLGGLYAVALTQYTLLLPVTAPHMVLAVACRSAQRIAGGRAHGDRRRTDAQHQRECRARRHLRSTGPRRRREAGRGCGAFVDTFALCL